MADHPLHHQSPFSNPVAPPGHVIHDKDDAKPLSNEDFRKLVMSTRGNSVGGAKDRVLGMGHSVRGVRVSGSVPSTPNVSSAAAARREEREASERRKKKKTEYLKQRKLELEKEAELANRYRDRAKERRAHQENEGEGDKENADKTTQNYHAVNPNAKEGEASQRRNQIIEESKFLGGDIEHTHLVKGLDYALLSKVKAEIYNKQNEDDEDLMVEGSASSTTTTAETRLASRGGTREDAKAAAGQEPRSAISSISPTTPRVESKSAMAKNIHRIVFRQLPERNELFAPGRMAYLVDLEEEEESVDCDVPTTVIRSKMDCLSSSSSSSSSPGPNSANDVVVSKLTQILSYLRQGNRGKKWKKKFPLSAKDERLFDPAAEEGIFGDFDGVKINPAAAAAAAAGEGGSKAKEGASGAGGGGGGGGVWAKSAMKVGGRASAGAPDGKETKERKEESRTRGRGEGRGRSQSPRRDRSRDRRESSRGRDAGKKRETRVRFANCDDDDDDGKEDSHSAKRHQQQEPKSAAELIQDINAKFGSVDGVGPNKSQSTFAQKLSNDCYVECYPGMDFDVVDSDDEADYSKMDQGNKKGPVGRWDFETTEEYSDYMSLKEAMPKAAFQFGVKMADGRKTRRIKPQNEKQKLEREWKQISQILERRKGQ